MLKMNRVEASFKQHEIVPQLIPVAPKESLRVIYEKSNEVNLGEELTPTQVQNEPQVSWDADSNALYTLVMADPDAPSRNRPIRPEGLHWLVINIPGNNIKQGQTLANYAGAGPPPFTGLHRYIFLLYKQNGKITDNELARIGSGLRNRHQSIVAITKKHNLNDPIAGNFFQARYDSYVLKFACSLICCCCCR